MGTLAANSEYAKAVNIAAIAPIRNDIRIPGPIGNYNGALFIDQCTCTSWIDHVSHYNNTYNDNEQIKINNASTVLHTQSHTTHMYAQYLQFQLPLQSVNIFLHLQYTLHHNPTSLLVPISLLDYLPLV